MPNFSGFGDDLHVKSGLIQEPVSGNIKVALISGSHADLLGHHALPEAGIDESTLCHVRFMSANYFPLKTGSLFSRKLATPSL